VVHRDRRRGRCRRTFRDWPRHNPENTMGHLLAVKLEIHESKNRFGRRQIDELNLTSSWDKYLSLH
jgi:hypothetical protein